MRLVPALVSLVSRAVVLVAASAADCERNEDFIRAVGIADGPFLIDVLSKVDWNFSADGIVSIPKIDDDEFSSVHYRLVLNSPRPVTNRMFKSFRDGDGAYFSFRVYAEWDRYSFSTACSSDDRYGRFVCHYGMADAPFLLQALSLVGAWTFGNDGVVRIPEISDSEFKRLFVTLSMESPRPLTNRIFELVRDEEGARLSTQSWERRRLLQSVGELDGNFLVQVLAEVEWTYDDGVVHVGAVEDDEFARLCKTLLKRSSFTRRVFHLVRDGSGARFSTREFESFLDSFKCGDGAVVAAVECEP